MKRNYSNYIWGLMFILLGIFVVLKSFDVISGSIFFTGWWSLFIIIPAAINTVVGNNRVWDASMLLVGIGLLMAANEWYVTYKNVWSIAVCLLFVNIGIGIMRGNKARQKHPGHNSSGNYVAVFSSCDEKPATFTGGTAVAVFGGVDLDLRDIVFTQDVYLTAVSIFGGIDIYVNDNVNVSCSTINAFGGSGSEQQNIEGNYNLFIDGCAVFGGVDVKKNRENK